MLLLKQALLIAKEHFQLQVGRQNQLVAKGPGYLVQFGSVALLHHGLAGSDPALENILSHIGTDNGF